MSETKSISQIKEGTSSNLIGVGLENVGDLSDYTCQMQLVNPSGGPPLVDRAIIDNNVANDRFLFRLSVAELSGLSTSNKEDKFIVVRITRTANNPTSEQQVSELEIRFAYVDSKFV